MFRFDTTTASHVGQRAYQEDATICDFQLGSSIGFAVIADGMGGHAAGDVASQVAIKSAFSALLRIRSEIANARSIGVELRALVQDANTAIREHSARHPKAEGMGTTLVATVIQDGSLYWASVGDSPLYLFRDDSLTQINDDHSLAPQIDLLVENGLLGSDEGQDHPDRNVLTSVLVGADISKLDCPTQPLKLQIGDIVLVASDGLQTLTDEQIEGTLQRLQLEPSADIVATLLDEVHAQNDQDQDNVSFTAIRVLATKGSKIMPEAHVLPRFVTHLRDHVKTALRSLSNSPSSLR